MKNDCKLFSRPFIVSQYRDGELKDFFSHENQPYPPALSLNGLMRNIITALTELVPGVCTTSEMQPSDFDLKIFDGTALVHMLPLGPSKTFQVDTKTLFLFIRIHIHYFLYVFCTGVCRYPTIHSENVFQ